MGTLLDNLLNEARHEPGAVTEPFKPVARYYPSMDFLLFLKEDCSYRADRVDPFLTLLWHPVDQRLVGVKLKGFRFIFDVLRSVLDLKDEQFLPLVKALELAMVGGVATAIMRKAEQERVQQLYDQAKQIAAGVTFDPRDMYQQAA